MRCDRINLTERNTQEATGGVEVENRYTPWEKKTRGHCSDKTDAPALAIINLNDPIKHKLVGWYDLGG